MARLIGIRRLDEDLAFSSTSTLATLSSDAVECFSNPAFEAGSETDGELCVSSSDTSISTDRNGDVPASHRGQKQRQEEMSTDSGVQICIPAHGALPEDSSSSIGRTSPDSGVHDEESQTRAVQDGRRPSGKKGWQHSSFRRQSIKDFVKDIKKEKLWAICLQIIIPFLIAGAGTCGAGIVLDHVEKWEVFKKVTELYILVPTLLGLKGNLEMTLASRISTQANLGKLDTLKKKLQMTVGNMALVQCQATAMGLLAAGFAAVTNYVKSPDFQLSNVMLLCASSLFTALTASLVLGTITIAVVLVSHKCRINPDNVATPIAASLGDVTTLGILAAVSNYLYSVKDNSLPPALIVFISLLLIPVWLFLSYKNPFVKQVLYTGWLPIICALLITSFGGYVLEFSVGEFTGFAIFQPVINGVAGNLVAVQASRISTYFHQHSEKPGSSPPDGSSVCVTPLHVFFGKSAHSLTARILLALVVPGHVIFGYTINFIQGGNTVLTPSFLPIYLAAAFLQVTFLLYIAQCLVHGLWRYRIDPDNSAIPLLTAMGDLSGTACLTAAFYIRQHANIQ